MSLIKPTRLTKRYKGGGGTTTTVESIPSWAKPYITKAMGEAESKYASGALSKVAGPANLQQKAFTEGAGAIGKTAEQGITNLAEQQQRLKDMAATGGRDELMQTAAYEAAKAGAGLDRQAGAAGVLGSARGDIGRRAMEAEMLSAANQQVLKNKLAAEQALGESSGAAQKMAESATAAYSTLGGQQRDISQAIADKDWTALQRYASTIYGSPAKQQAVSGGK